MPHAKNQDTFSNYTPEVEREGHTGLSQLPRRKKQIFLGNCNYWKTVSKQKSCFFSLAISNIHTSSLCLSFNLCTFLSTYISVHPSVWGFLYLCPPLSSSLLLFTSTSFPSWFRIPRRGAELIKRLPAAGAVSAPRSAPRSRDLLSDHRQIGPKFSHTTVGIGEGGTHSLPGI